MTPFTLVAQRQIRKQKSNVHLNYSAVINILCDVIADVVNLNVRMHPLTSDDRALIRASVSYTHLTLPTNREV